MKKLVTIPCDSMYFKLLKEGTINYCIMVHQSAFKVGFSFRIQELKHGVLTGNVIKLATITHVLDASRCALQVNTFIYTLSIQL